MRVFTILLIFISLHINNYAQTLRIGLFNESPAKSYVFSVIKGKYLVTADKMAIVTLQPGQNIFASINNDSVLLIGNERRIGDFKLIKFKSMADSGVFSLRQVNPQSKLRLFDDNLELTVMWDNIQAVNNVDLEKYLAGVVESEGGVKATIEYYKTQAVLCRTYVLSHLDRHAEENFLLCDGVHCQAYNGKSMGNALIPQAAFDTRGLVVTDADSVLITAAFHASCGGETESSENVWLINKSYLKPVQDPYCQNQRSYTWEQKVTLDRWKSFLHQQGFKIKPDVSPSWFNFIQLSRKSYYKLGRDSVAFRKIRTDFSLKSAFFSVQAEGNNIVFKGHGYGHGIGLCQEGAMQMSKLRYNFREIIQFYYQGVNITNFTDVPVNKNATLLLISTK
jgi:stage II sporulation protein D